MRVVASITCLFAAKCCNVIVPLSFKEVIDSFGGNPAAVASVALPVALLAAYASSRLMAGLFSELRSALFARGGAKPNSAACGSLPSTVP